MSGTFIYLPPSGGSAYWGDAVANFASLPAAGEVTGEAILVLDTLTIYAWDGAVWQPIVNGPADVSGPASSLDGQLTLFDGTSGKIIKGFTGTGYVKSSSGVVSAQAVPIPIADGGTNSTTALSNNRVVQSSGGKIQEAAAITASRALASDVNGIPVAATTTAVELDYVSGVTSAIQTQLNAKEPTITILPISKGGTNSGTALNNNRVIKSSGGAVVEAAAITASKALESDSNGIPVASATTATELGYVSGVTSAIQTQINTKVTGPASSTDLALMRFDSTTGKLAKNSVVTLSDAGGMTFNGSTGFLRLPNLTTTERDALTPAVGMCIMNTSLNRPQVYIATTGWVSFLGFGE